MPVIVPDVVTPIPLPGVVFEPMPLVVKNVELGHVTIAEAEVEMVVLVVPSVAVAALVMVSVAAWEHFVCE